MALMILFSQVFIIPIKEWWEFVVIMGWWSIIAAHDESMQNVIAI